MEGMIMNQQQLQQIENDPTPDLQMGLDYELDYELDLERDIYRQEENGFNLSGILLAVLTIPVAFFILQSLIGR
jgi:hypothetical protein